MKFCIECGAELGPAQRFCGGCGTRTAAEAGISPNGPEPAPPTMAYGASPTALATLARPAVAPTKSVADHEQDRAGEDVVGWTWRRIAAITLAALIVVGVGDWVMRNWEMSRLLTAVERSENATKAAGDRISSEGGKFDASSPSNQQRAVLDAMQTEASKGVTETLDAADEVRGVFVLPWHRGIADARSKYLKHNQAWADHFRASSQDLKSWFTQSPDISATWRIAIRAWHEAVPAVPLFGVKGRVDDIFAD